MSSKLLLPLLFLLLFACSKENEIEESKLVKLYVDLIIVDETYQFNLDSLAIHKKKVFEKYQVTEQNYVEAINLLGEDDEKWEMFFQKSLAYLETLRERDKIN
ncbi:MAG: hypothetical protein ABIG69_08095 [Bacteroidota bacterium]